MTLKDSGWNFPKKRGQSSLRMASKEDSVIPDSLLKAYEAFEQTHRGLSAATLKNYRNELLNMRTFLDQHGRTSIKQVRLADLDAFLMKKADRYGAEALKHLAGGVRSFFRYLHWHGMIEADLAEGIISPCRFRSNMRPKYVPYEKIERFLSSIDRRRNTGKRDYAILLLLARNGLRAREVAKLRVCDVDEVNQALFLRQRKDGDAVQMPISMETVNALRDYLAVRPACSSPELFLTAQIPVRPLGYAVSGVAQFHLQRFFTDLPFPRGAYLLRHTLAKAMLDRGAPLHEVGAVLGHGSARSTLIYSRIAVKDMREVADNYADLL